MAVTIFSIPSVSADELKKVAEEIRVAIVNKDIYVTHNKIVVTYVDQKVPAALECDVACYADLSSKIQKAKENGDLVFVNYPVKAQYLPSPENPPLVVIS